MRQEQQQYICTSMDPVLLFDIYVNGKKAVVTVDLNCWYIPDIVSIKIQDIIGLKKKQLISQQQSKYSLYSYPKRKKKFKTEQRYIQKFDFTVKGQDWIMTQKQLISRLYNRQTNKSLKLLIYFNPVSGSNSKKCLDKVTQFVKFTNLQIQVFTTNHRNHCIQHLQTIDKNDYCGVAIVSGDGLMHQFVNSFCQIPVTHVPAGSGNAFAKTQMSYAGQLCKVEESIFLVIKNKPKKFNLVKYELQKIPNPIYSFLSLQWAMMSDLDINSQFLRCLGVLRFQVYAVWLLLRLKQYRSKITYSTTQTQMPPFSTDLDGNPDYLTVKDNMFSNAIFCTIPYISQKHKMAPLLKQGEHYIDMQLVSHRQGRFQLAKYLLGSDSGSQFDLKQQRPKNGYQFIYQKITSFRLEPLQGGAHGIFCIDGQMYEQQKIQASLSDKTFQAFV